IRLRSILVGEVYSKALRRRLAVKEKSAEKSDGEEESGDENKEDEPAVKDMGGIINLMAVDAFKVSEIAGYLHFFTSSTITSVLAVVLLYKLLGWSSLVGTVSLLALMPLTYRITTTLAGYQKKMLEVTDKRIQKINETFQNIRVIKYFGWEEKFADTIIGIRNEELRFLLLRCYAWTCSAFLWCVAPSIVSLVTFYFFTVWQGESLTTPIAFTSLSLFNLLRTPLDQLAEMMSFVIQSKVSLDRIEQFLDEPETEKYDQLTYPRGPDSPLVGFENATFYWSKNSKNEFALRDLNIDFKVGKLNVIVGPTGSGKTSLLLALLGEMDLDKGHVFLPGASAREELIPNPVTGLVESVAYCAQTAWLLNATIKENILFASPFNQERYDAVIYACGLARDLEILEAGDETEIGEKGITLSGGQKQRVSLARALYSSSSYLLLDDCLSAVDSHTAVHIYDNCINGELMKGRTCLLVSHNVALTIKEADHVVVLDNGRVKAQGSVDKLIEDGVLAEDTIKSVLVSRSVSTANLDELADKQDVKQTLKSAGQALVNASNADVKDPDKKQGKSKLVEEETKSDGAVKKEVYYAYFKHFGSIPFWIILIFSFGATQGVFVEQSYWLRLWAAREDEKVGVSMNAVSHAVGYITSGAAWQDSVAFFRNWSSSPYLTTSVLQPIASSAEEHGTMFYIAIYAAIGFLYAGFIVFRLLLCFYGGINVSKKMFGELLNKVLHARLRFFDQTPIGRIMNRFSKDIEGIDQELAPCADSFLDCLISCLTILVMICVVTPGFIFAALIIFALYVAVGALYLTLSRDLKRFESITKSPIHQHFSETLAGMTTIRAYGEERRFLRQNLDKIDANNRPFWYVWVNNRWLAYRADIIGAFISFFAAVFAVAFAYTLDAGLAGISLSFAVSFRQSALWLVRMYSYVEINMNSVERVQEYIEGTPQEPAKVLPQDPVNSWPSEGVIDVKNISIRYAPDLPRVIDDVSFHVNAGEKIGVVGRTGAGKSTIITSFFRFVDLDDGSITIDGLDISKIGLKALRQGLAIIPQDPTLFTGTIRSNLDMFQEYSDLEMFESLRRVNLISGLDFQRIVNCNGAPVEDEAAATEENANKFLDLDSAVTEGGANLSQGERQLLCLARSILKTPKILMLDEATASIDYESDAKIQTTIREEFLASTILTIAHRLKTIIDYDKILVLDHGKVKEFDHPYKLITDKKSDFRKMCQDTGEFDELPVAEGVLDRVQRVVAPMRRPNEGVGPVEHAEQQDADCGKEVRHVDDEQGERAGYGERPDRVLDLVCDDVRGVPAAKREGGLENGRDERGQRDLAFLLEEVVPVQVAGHAGDARGQNQHVNARQRHDGQQHQLECSCDIGHPYTSVRGDANNNAAQHHVHTADVLGGHAVDVVPAERVERVLAENDGVGDGEAERDRVRVVQHAHEHPRLVVDVFEEHLHSAAARDDLPKLQETEQPGKTDISCYQPDCKEQCGRASKVSIDQCGHSEDARPDDTLEDHHHHGEHAQMAAVGRCFWFLEIVHLVDHLLLEVQLRVQRQHHRRCICDHGGGGRRAIMWKAEVLERLVFDENQMIKAYTKFPSIALKYYPNARYCKKLQLGFSSHEDFDQCVRLLETHNIPTQTQEKGASQLRSQVDFGSQMPFSQSSQLEKPKKDQYKSNMVDTWSQKQDTTGAVEPVSNLADVDIGPNFDFLNSVNYASFQEEETSNDTNTSLSLNNTTLEMANVSTSTSVSCVDFCGLSDKELGLYVLGKLKEENFNYMLYKLDRIIKK
ncbi:hypothetical protein OGAPHI_001019, partial [Ogataea philodendri]